MPQVEEQWPREPGAGHFHQVRRGKRHVNRPSSPVVPVSELTLLFANAVAAISCDWTQLSFAFVALSVKILVTSENGVLPDNFMVPNSLKACGTLMWIGFDKGVHGYVEKMGLGGCVFVASSLIDFYGKWRLS
ncbi:hypothetical protein NL676_029487 [Syzygium grande]|nr:hypothetical protein NL676_029487 [Syzygium grande]